MPHILKEVDQEFYSINTAASSAVVYDAYCNIVWMICMLIMKI